MNDSEKYNDIIDLPHHRSTKRPQMPRADRAAQFSPFAALKGYDGEIEETARYTDERNELDESAQSDLNEKLVALKERERERPNVTVCYFQPDEKKTGGKYITFTGSVKKVDDYRRALVFEEGEVVLFERIIEIE